MSIAQPHIPKEPKPEPKKYLPREEPFPAGTLVSVKGRTPKESFCGTVMKRPMGELKESPEGGYMIVRSGTRVRDPLNFYMIENADQDGNPIVMAHESAIMAMFTTEGSHTLT